MRRKVGRLPSGGKLRALEADIQHLVDTCRAQVQPGAVEICEERSGMRSITRVRGLINERLSAGIEALIDGFEQRGGAVYGLELVASAPRGCNGIRVILRARMIAGDEDE